MKRTSAMFSILVLSILSLSARTMQREMFVSRVVIKELRGPWEIIFGPDGYLWVTERTGKQVTRVNPVNGTRTIAVSISEVFQNHGQDGLLGMALHPQLLGGTDNDYVYVAYTYDADPGPQLSRRGKIRRYTYNLATRTLKDPLDLITNLPAGSDHVAGRLAFGPDQKLYFTVGDQGSGWQDNYCLPNRAQALPSAADVEAKDWTKYQGKILRLNLDGSIPLDNPTLDGVRSHVYSYGHRNAQGLVFGPGGKLYASEHGPNTDDEVNLIESGKNYGWPNVAGYNDDQAYVFANWSQSSPVPCRSLTFNATEFPPSVPIQKESAWSHRDFRPPLKTFFTVGNDYNFRVLGAATIAPSGLDIYTKDVIPDWANSLLLTSLTKGTIYRLKLSSDGLSIQGEVLEYFKSMNRYRDIAINPDGGTIYISTDEGAILAFGYQR